MDIYGEGHITGRDNPDQDLSDLNRDIDTAQEILKDQDETTDVYASTNSVGSLKGLTETGEDNTPNQWASNIGSIADTDSYKALADNAAQLGNADELKSGWEQAQKTLGVTGELPPELDAKNQQLRDQIVRELTEQNDGEVPDSLQLYLDQNGDIAAADVDGVPVYMDADLEQQFAAELEERSQRQATELALVEESDAYINALNGTLDDVWSNTDDQYYTALGASNQRFDELTAPELGSASEREHLAAYPEWREPLIADHDAWVDSVTTSGRQAAEFPLVAAETAGILGWNAYTMSVAGVGGLAVTPFKGREAGAQTIDAFMANYGYTPKLDGTRHTFDTIGQVFAPIDEQMQNAGNATLDTTGSPFLATTVHISPDLVGTLFGGLPGSARSTLSRGISKNGTDPSEFARAQQGQGAFPGVDEYNSFTLLPGAKVHQLTPGGDSPFFFTDDTLTNYGDSPGHIHESLQVPHNELYQPTIRQQYETFEVVALHRRLLVRSEQILNTVPEEESKW
ncbi:hypothetical protein [Marinimicrobium sp. LS-A18]|uniref:hypothetical protein n=1 Tax=Marinimicrobium sp. LS-A18 TaxID=1381596 RepID=UPI0004663C07|nr:hypothetical protein [Marinimicrobium sp. LS-A18]